MNHDQFQKQIRSLYKFVKEFEEMLLGRPFTPDGHMVGSIGKCLVADAYDLKLIPVSNKGFDATSRDGLQIEIKATQAEGVAFRSCPEHTIIKIMKNGTFEEYYNGPGYFIWETFKDKTMSKNGQ